MDKQYALREGMTVYGAGGDKVGKVVAVDPGFVVVEKGFFFPTDYYIPTSAIAGYTDGEISLNVTKDQALNQGWDMPPTADQTAAGPDGAETAACTSSTWASRSRSWRWLAT